MAWQILLVKIFFIALIGSLLCLDRILLQVMISRPIIIAPLTGLVLGNVYVGLIIGAILELFWIDRVPIGIYIPPNDSVASVVAVSVASLIMHPKSDVQPDLIAMAVLAAIPFGILVKNIDVRMMVTNNQLSDQAIEDAKKLDIRAIEKKTFLGVARSFAIYFFVILFAQAVLFASLGWVYWKLPESILGILKMIYYFMPLLGIAVALNTIKFRGTIPLFCAIFLTIAVFLGFFYGL
jgi:PTS system mannose-specific IIC component